MTSYVMEAKENYDAATAAEADAGTFAGYTFIDTTMLGYGYDATRRELVYVAIKSAHPNISGNAQNTTGHDLWDGLTPIVAGDFYSAMENFNFHLARKNIDTGVVTFYDAYDPAAVVPASIYGDGTARRYVSDTSVTDEYPVLTNPRNSDAWVHQDSCDLYLFRAADNWTMQISPLRPTANPNDPLIPRGMNDNWVYATEIVDTYSVRNLYLIPPGITAAEIAADKILAYGTFAIPAAVDMHWHRTAIDAAGDLWLFTQTTGSSPFTYQLFHFTQPTSIPTPGAPVGGGFAEVTPWAAGTGPNAPAFTNQSGLHCLFSNSRGQLELITSGDVFVGGVLCGRVQHTWYDLTAHTWGTTDLGNGYVTAGFAPTADPAAAAYLLTGAFKVCNQYLDVDNHYADSEYASRWFWFEVNRVTGGVVDPAGNPFYVMVELTWQAGAAPTIAQVIDESGWDDAYPTYAADVAHGGAVVAQSVDRTHNITFFMGGDAPLWDATSQAFWVNAAGPTTSVFFDFDATYTPRSGASGPSPTVAQPPLMRLSFGPPPVPIRRPQVWSTIGPPQL